MVASESANFHQFFWLNFHFQIRHSQSLPKSALFKIEEWSDYHTDVKILNQEINKLWSDLKSFKTQKRVPYPQLTFTKGHPSTPSAQKPQKEKMGAISPKITSPNYTKFAFCIIVCLNKKRNRSPLRLSCQSYSVYVIKGVSAGWGLLFALFALFLRFPICPTWKTNTDMLRHKEKPKGGDIMLLYNYIRQYDLWLCCKDCYFACKITTPFGLPQL